MDHFYNNRGISSLLGNDSVNLPAATKTDNNREYAIIILKVKAKVTLRLTVSQSLNLGVETHLGLMIRYLLLFDNYGLVLCGAPSLTRGRVYHLYMLLVLTSAVFLGTESLGSHDHVLLSQI
jgi:hypothetical protein